MSKHTPGPWRVVASVTVRAGGKNVCAHVNAASSERLNMADEYEVAKANARLIAAAPELLEALETCEAFFFSAGLTSSDAYSEVCAAIAKATGEPA